MDQNFMYHIFREVHTPSKYRSDNPLETARKLAYAHATQPFIVEERDMGSVWGIRGFLARWPTREIADATLEALLERIAMELMRDG